MKYYALFMIISIFTNCADDSSEQENHKETTAANSLNSVYRTATPPSPTEIPIKSHDDIALLSLEAKIFKTAEMKDYLCTLPSDTPALIHQISDLSISIRLDRHTIEAGCPSETIYGHIDPSLIHHPNSEDANIEVKTLISDLKIFKDQKNLNLEISSCFISQGNHVLIQDNEIFLLKGGSCPKELSKAFFKSRAGLFKE